MSLLISQLLRGLGRFVTNAWPLWPVLIIVVLAEFPTIVHGLQYGIEWLIVNG